MTRSPLLAALSLLAMPLPAQVVRPTPAPRAITLTGAAPNAARLGLTLGTSDANDTLGVLVSEVMPDGPAAKAGLKPGDRLQSINGVNLKIDASDRDDPSLADLMMRRVTREMATRAPGDEITLRVLSGSASRTVMVTAVAARDLAAAAMPRVVQGSPIAARRPPVRDRAALGLQLGGAPSVRDTAGVFVIAVSVGGPAEKAGIVEGERIARINGVDLRVPRADAGDVELSQARVTRLQREVEKIEVGAVVTLTVLAGGRSREVRVTTTKASAIAGETTYFFQEGAMNTLRGMPAIIEQRQIDDAMKRAQESLERVRITLPGRRVIVV